MSFIRCQLQPPLATAKLQRVGFEQVEFVLSNDWKQSLTWQCSLPASLSSATLGQGYFFPLVQVHPISISFAAHGK